MLSWVCRTKSKEQIKKSISHNGDDDQLGWIYSKEIRYVCPYIHTGCVVLLVATILKKEYVGDAEHGGNLGDYLLFQLGE